VVLADKFLPNYHTTKAWAFYDKVVIHGYNTSFRLEISGNTRIGVDGNAGDSLLGSDKMQVPDDVFSP